MSLGQAITQFFGTPAGTGVIVVMLLSVLEFLLGTFRAIADNVFQLDSVAAWIRKHLAGRVLPIVAVLVIGHLAGGLTFDDGVSDALDAGGIITAIGLGAAAVYVAELLASIRESLTAGTAKVPQD